MTLSLTAAQLAGVFCDAIFYGMFLVTCTGSIRVLLMTGRGREERWRRPSEIRWMMAIVALLLFIICTLDIAMGFSRNFRAFVNPGDPLVTLLSPTDWTNIGQPVNEAIGAWVADFILVREWCWIVYGRRWLVIIPSGLLYLANVGISLRVFAMMGASRGVPTLANPSAFQAFRNSLLGFCATIAAQNVLTTGVLIWRIWLVEKSQAKVFKFGDRPRYFYRISAVLAESGAAYTTVVLIVLGCAAAASPALYVVENLMVQTAGIAFNLILVRCSPERDHQFTTYYNKETATVQASNNSTTLASNSTLFSRRNKPHDIELMGVDSDGRSSNHDFESKGIKVSKQVEVDV
ncbi:hypothetical protein AN958_01043 [Leucoagaricus sp. SymC.cos]|nr:hypothetical protein AN958_01043 [Leucoagaricus sp. SymC.cos]